MQQPVAQGLGFGSGQGAGQALHPRRPFRAGDAGARHLGTLVENRILQAVLADKEVQDRLAGIGFRERAKQLLDRSALVEDAVQDHGDTSCMVWSSTWRARVRCSASVG